MKLEANVLLEWSHDGQDHRFQLNEGEVFIGRQQKADLILDLPSVSRTHASIVSNEGTFHIEDLESSYGTKINGVRIKPFQACRLNPGDEIHIGKIKLLFHPPVGHHWKKKKRLFQDMKSKQKLNVELENLRKTLFQHVSDNVDSARKAEHLNHILAEELNQFRSYIEPKFNEYAVLQEITQIIIGILDVKELLATALDLVSEALEADRGFIILYDAQQGSLRSMIPRHFDREDNSACEYDFTFSQTIAKSCFENKKIIVLEDALLDDRFSSAHSIMASSIRSVVCIPLQRGKEVTGVIYLDHLSRPGIFDEHHADFLYAFSAQTAMALENARLYTQAVTDPLTGLYNRKFINERIFEEMVRSRRYNRDCSLIMLDIDHFKRVNDTFGHGVGDRVIERVADLLREIARASDVVARYGGEEFLMLLTETDAEGARSFAERVRKSIEESTIVSGKKEIKVTISSGVACYRDTFQNKLAAFVAETDRALYRAKKAGRNRVCVSGDA